VPCSLGFQHLRLALISGLVQRHAGEIRVPLNVIATQLIVQYFGVEIDKGPLLYWALAYACILFNL
jgi:hypothetical protein